VKQRQSNPPAGPVTFEDLYAEHGDSLPSLLWLFGVAEQDREDVAQDVWEEVHTSLPLFDPTRGSARAWIGRIARNVAIDHHRAIGRRREVLTEPDHELSTTHTAEADAADAERRALLWAYFERVLAEAVEGRPSAVAGEGVA
jgi:RNA polymerase sigma factor (sigma-70 family)